MDTVAHDRFRFESEGERHKRRVAAINSPLSVHRSFYGCNLAAFIRADTSRIIYTGAPRGFTAQDSGIRYRTHHAKYPTNCGTRKRDLGVVLVRVSPGTAVRAACTVSTSDESVFHCVSTPSSTRGRVDVIFLVRSVEERRRTTTTTTTSPQLRSVVGFLGMCCSPASMFPGFTLYDLHYIARFEGSSLRSSKHRE